MWIRIRAVIIEDEPLAAQYLAALLDGTFQVEVVGSATESEAGLRPDRYKGPRASPAAQNSDASSLGAP
jgi:DNA-binding NarL/FixJ family response regulator